MGREIRKVVPNWKHPKKHGEGGYQPLCDEPYIEVINEWIKEHQLWEKGEHPDQQGENGADYKYYAQWEGNPPDVEHYQPNWKSEEMTWFQVYETVSEGTPVTPPFATKEELINYLVEKGDFWDQQRGHGGWERVNAEKFVERGFALSMVLNTDTGEIKMPRDGQE